MENCYLSLVLFEVCLCMSGDGGYVVTVELLTYKNPTHYRAQSKDCCDALCSPCDNRFTFCFSDEMSTAEYEDIVRSRPERAACGCQYATELVEAANDDIMFEPGQPIDRNTPNPLVFHGHRWPGRAVLFVMVHDVDYDPADLDDMVDAVLIPISSDAGSGFSEPTVFDGIFNYGQLKVRFKVDCEDNFYGQDCTVFCRDRDHEEGHYVCDSEGKPICIKGYTNVSSNCTKCTPAVGCSKVGGFCRHPGECVCHSGYSGENCTSEPSSKVSLTLVYILSGLVSFILLFLLLVVVVTVLCIVVWKKKKMRPDGRRESTGEYVNEGLGPNISTIDNTEYRHNTLTGVGRVSVQLSESHDYDTIPLDHDIESNVNTSNNRSSNDTVTGQTTTRNIPTSATHHPQNSAYGIDLHSNPHCMRSKIKEPIYHNMCWRTV